MTRLEWALSEPPPQDGRVAGLEAQGAGIAGHVGAALVDDADDTQRHPHSRDLQAVGPRPFRRRRADGIGQRGDVLDSAGHGLDALLVESQAVQHGPGRAFRPRGLDIPRIRV
jgi:hypothetical protein